MRSIFISVGAAGQSKFTLMELQQVGGQWETHEKQPMLGRTVIHFDHHTFSSLFKITPDTFKKFLDDKKYPWMVWYGPQKNNYSNNIYQQYSIY